MEIYVQHRQSEDGTRTYTGTGAVSNRDSDGFRGSARGIEQTTAQVQAQHAEIAGMEKLSDEMIKQILELTDAFHQIDQQYKIAETELGIGEKGMG